MNIYKVTFKEKRGQSCFDQEVLLVIAADYGNAEDRAMNSQAAAIAGTEIKSIVLYGETTSKTDVFILKER